MLKKLKAAAGFYRTMLGLFIRHPGAFRYIYYAIKYRRKALRAARKLMRGQFPGVAAGDTLDRYGTTFGFPRKPGEPDDDYRCRILKIIQEVQR